MGINDSVCPPFCCIQGVFHDRNAALAGVLVTKTNDITKIVQNLKLFLLCYQDVTGSVYNTVISSCDYYMEEDKMICRGKHTAKRTVAVIMAAILTLSCGTNMVFAEADKETLGLEQNIDNILGEIDGIKENIAEADKAAKEAENLIQTAEAAKEAADKLVKDIENAADDNNTDIEFNKNEEGNVTADIKNDKLAEAEKLTEEINKQTDIIEEKAEELDEIKKDMESVVGEEGDKTDEAGNGTLNAYAEEAAKAEEEAKAALEEAKAAQTREEAKAAADKAQAAADSAKKEADKIAGEIGYKFDENNNVVKDADGNPVVDTESTGTLYESLTNAETAYNEAIDAARAAGIEFETDAEGNILYDEEGSAIVKDIEGGLNEQLKQAVSDAKAQLEKLQEDVETAEAAYEAKMQEKLTAEEAFTNAEKAAEAAQKAFDEIKTDDYKKSEADYNNANQALAEAKNRLASAQEAYDNMEADSVVAAANTEIANVDNNIEAYKNSNKAAYDSSKAYVTNNQSAYKAAKKTMNKGVKSLTNWFGVSQTEYNNAKAVVDAYNAQMSVVTEYENYLSNAETLKSAQNTIISNRKTEIANELNNAKLAAGEAQNTANETAILYAAYNKALSTGIDIDVIELDITELGTYGKLSDRLAGTQTDYDELSKDVEDYKAAVEEGEWWRVFTAAYWKKRGIELEIENKYHNENLFSTDGTCYVFATDKDNTKYLLVLEGNQASLLKLDTENFGTYVTAYDSVKAAQAANEIAAAKQKESEALAKRDALKKELDAVLSELEANKTNTDKLVETRATYEEILEKYEEAENLYREASIAYEEAKEDAEEAGIEADNYRTVEFYVVTAYANDNGSKKAIRKEVIGTGVMYDNRVDAPKLITIPSNVQTLIASNSIVETSRMFFSNTWHIIYEYTDMEVEAAFYALKADADVPASEISSQPTANYDYVGKALINTGRMQMFGEENIPAEIQSIQFGNADVDDTKYTWYVVKLEADGWHVDGYEEGLLSVQFINTYTGENYAKYYEMGSKAVIPALKSVSGYTAEGWASAGSEYSLSDCKNVTRSMTFYAVYEETEEETNVPLDTPVIDIEDEETPLTPPVTDFEDEKTPLDAMPKTGRTSLMIPAVLVAAVSLGAAFIIKKKKTAEE